jgi:hypothetical protein
VSRVQEAIADRGLSYPGVTAALDRLSVAEVIAKLGPCDREIRRYQEAPPVRLSPDGPLQTAWTVGDGRPALATDDPAEVVAMNLCVLARTPQIVRVVGVTNRHPGPCGWCDYPIAELHRAIAHATYFGRLLRDHLLIWDGEDGSLYVRAGEEDGRYQHQDWQAMAELHPGAQRQRVADVLAVVREGATA